MTDSNDQTDKTIRAGARKPLSLQRTVESGHVRQNFSHGRSKSVVVEKKKTRRLGAPGSEAGDAAPATATTTIEAPPPPLVKSPPPAAKPAPSSSSQGRTLSNEERAARERALAAARAEGASRAVEAEPVRFEPVRPPEPEPRVEEVAPQAQTAPPAAAPAAAPVAPKPAEASPAPVARETTAPPPRERRDASAPQQREGGRPQFQRSSGRPTGNTAYMPREAGRPREIELPIPPRRGAAPADATTIEKPVRPQRPAVVAREQVEEDDSRKRGPGGVKVPRPAVKTNDDGRQRQKLTITNFDREAQVRSLASLKRKREKEKLKAMGIQQPREKISREVVIPEAITIQELSNRMAERAVDLIKYLMQQGAMHKITDVLDADTAELIVQEFGHTPKRVSEADVEIGFVGDEDADAAALEARAPVVTIMGHVDHGKTSLLDAIRSANVVAGEAGGITQHIGAYQVKASNGDKITFIDTPGHEAFTAMRARGAKVTDIVVLVVAADDGVMPQTVEAINHAKAAKVPIIVAINKIDKPQADPNRVRTDLLSQEIVVESMGGETLEVPVSALKRTNLDKLLEAIHLQAEILDLKANPKRTAEGIVIEAKLERGRGPVGTVLVQRGTLRVGDIIVAGTAWGRVRALLDDHGANIDSAGPSVPAEVLGFDSAPEAGDQFAVVENEARARELTDYRVRKRRETLGSAGSKSTLEQMMQQLKDAERKEFPLVVKGDVQGSVEAIAGALRKVGNDEVEARLVHSGVGGITESDIALAAASKAVVIGFNVRANAQAKQAADSQGIEIRYYNIIYDLVDEVKAAMSGLLAPTKREVFLGYASIKQVFNISKVGKVAGCQVTEGKVERGAKVRLLRDNVVIHEGTLAILKRFKDDVKEVVAGQECGMSFANYQDIREGDQIECFQVETIARSL
ncbi:MAG TPA: translation initiation factor IF-2 [Hyphomicrobium sp.]|nr:translation initiation factor IF-2 [Hyphomicrobium sp.]